VLELQASCWWGLGLLLDHKEAPALEFCTGALTLMD
jgi:hypothetical protein